MGTYSTGMKQRVKLAQALVHDPVLAFLDEPTAGLDPLGRREMLELIRRVGARVRDQHRHLDAPHGRRRARRATPSSCSTPGELLRTGAVSGFTEETETLEVELVEGAAALADGASPARPRAAARRQPPDARRACRATTTTRCATRSSSRARCSTGSPRRGTRSRTSSSPEPTPRTRRRTRRDDRARARSSTSATAATRASAPAAGTRRRAIWRDGDPDLARARARRRREDRALAPARASPSSRSSCSSSSRRSSALARRTRTTSSCRRTPTTTTGRSCRSASSRPSSRRCSLCPDRRDGVLSLYAARPITPLDYVGARWAAFLTVGAGGRLAARGDPLRLERARRSSSPGRGSVDNWDVVPRFLAAGATVAVVLTTLALLRRVVRHATRVRVGRDPGRALHRLRDRRHRRGQLLRLASPTRSRSRASRRRSSTPSTGSSATTLERPLPGWRLAALARRADRRARRLARAPDDEAGARMTSHDTTPTIVVDGLSKWFAGVVAVSDVSLVVEPGVTALLGPNGAGKTTLLRAIARPDRAVAGHGARSSASRCAATRRSTAGSATCPSTSRSTTSSPAGSSSS